MASVTFYFDVGSPYAYLAAERMDALVARPVRWQPVLLGGLFRLTGRSSWALGDYRRRQAGMAEIERRARSYGLPPVRWPDPWPSDYLLAMRAVTFAFGFGLAEETGREFAFRAFRDAFQRGSDLSIPARLYEAAGAVGLDRAEVAAATENPGVKAALRDATQAAYELGVFGVPTFAVGDELFWGDDRLEDAAGHLSKRAAA
ncbi:MAG: 2-hydroxychromene-2-carboxylate isomerase [Solirubrobacterales bacterium]|nr:2-hydroxychromene-2-carboxylate isomerase [Solirubrobacterales bacterium]MBV9714751.1 2-hydroxychromene-2-carboxylate isomerase [Solirubrobacterales bacterium]